MVNCIRWFGNGAVSISNGVANALWLVGVYHYFLFWAPMIKATRIWGGLLQQGKAFSWLDGGRGLTGALFSLIGVVVFSIFLGEEVMASTLLDRQQAFAYVISIAAILIVGIGILVWFFMKSTTSETAIQLEKIDWKTILAVLKLPSVWMLMVLILCGYVGYKITDIISQYAEEVMHYNQVDAAKTGTVLQFLRPTTGILLGLFADRLRITKLLFFGFVLTGIGGLCFASGVLAPNLSVLFFMAMLCLAIGVYAVRALYFGVMQVGQIPIQYTGTAVGLISLVGYTPDVFAGPAYGAILDAYPRQELGHQYVFLMLSVFAFVGAIVAWSYHKKYGHFQNRES